MQQLSQQEATNFINVLYSFCMSDRVFSQEEEKYVRTLSRGLFGMRDAPRVHLTGTDLFDAMMSIDDATARYFLIAIAIDMASFSKVKKRDIETDLKWIRDLMEKSALPSDMIADLNECLSGAGPKGFSYGKSGTSIPEEMKSGSTFKSETLPKKSFLSKEISLKNLFCRKR